MRTLGLAVLFLVAGCAVRTQALKPANHVNGAMLPLRRDSLTLYLVRGSDTTVTGWVIDELRLTQRGNAELIERVYQTQDAVLGSRRDTLIDVRSTLKPVAMRSRHTRGAEHIDFADDRARGWVWLASGDSTAVDASIVSEAHNTSSYDLVLRASPLAEGLALTVPLFMPDSRKIVPVKGRVVAAENIGGEACWRFDADFAGLAVTFWIGQTSRRLRQQVMHLQPGVQALFVAAQ